MYLLSQIADIVNGKLIGNGNLKCSFFVTDSRQINFTSDSLFFAITSNRNNGHLYIPELIEKGVYAFIISDETYCDDTKSLMGYVVVKDVLIALQALAAYHRRLFSIPIIGITGSNGKTVVKEWLYELLKKEFVICRSPKSYNSQIGVPLSILNLNKSHTLGIFEAGISEMNEMDRLEKIMAPSMGVFTFLGSAHDIGFQNKQQKLQEKLKLFKNSEKVILNKINASEDVFILKDKFIFIGEESKDKYVLTYKLDKENSEFQLNYNNITANFVVNFGDEASVLNSATCAVVLIEFGFSHEKIQAGLLQLQNIELRLEIKSAINNSIIINDFYNSDIDSIRIALNFLQQQQRKQSKVVVISDIEQSGESADNLYKELSLLLNQNKIDFVIGIGKTISAYKHLINCKAKYFLNTEEFISHSKELFNELSNASILLKGANSYNFNKVSKLLQQKSHDTVLEINLQHIAHNVNYFKSLVGPNVKMMCMVKATGYGSGSSEIATTLKHIGVNYLAVAYADEGVEIRATNNLMPIMVMSPEIDSFDDIIKYGLEPEIYSFRMLTAFKDKVEQSNLNYPFPIHIKIDTGMKRLGFEANEMESLIKILKDCKTLEVKSIFSHLVGSDNSTLDSFTKGQIELFQITATAIEKSLIISAIKHICNSSGISRFPKAHFNMVRLGIGMFGFGATEEEDIKLEHVGVLKTKISQIKKIKKNETVGYNRSGVVKEDAEIATIPIGYADGLNRALGNGNFGFKVNGILCYTVGNICMDMCMIDVSNVKCKEGDNVMVFENREDIRRMAKVMNSIPYEILTGVSERVKRVYIFE